MNGRSETLRRFVPASLLAVACQVALTFAGPGSRAADYTATKPGAALTFDVLDQRNGCTTAIAATERRYALPVGLLRAIAVVESGRPTAEGRVQPWPWTVNAQGEGRFFNSMLQAATWVRQQQSSGIQSIDVGCMQVNLHFHPTAFGSLEEAFDPQSNADYAARFLLSLYGTTHNWSTAVGYYHSQTDARAEAYRSRVQSAFGGGALPPPCVDPLRALQVAWRATTAAPDTRAVAGPLKGGWQVVADSTGQRRVRDGLWSQRLASAPATAPLCPAQRPASLRASAGNGIAG